MTCYYNTQVLASQYPNSSILNINAKIASILWLFNQVSFSPSFEYPVGKLSQASGTLACLKFISLFFMITICLIESVYLLYLIQDVLFCIELPHFTVILVIVCL